jgi:hypothetical protein
MARSTPASSFLATSLALGVLVLAGGSASGSAAGDVRAAASTRAKNAIQRENARAGTRAWSLDPTATKGQILGYASEVSVLPRETVHFHVSTTPAARYQIVLYRLGWYRGAGARRFACIPGCKSGRRGTPQMVPAPDPATGIVRAGWPVTDTYRFPPGAVSGYFLAKLQLISGPHDGKVSYVPLILRAPATRRSKILVQGSVNSWQASNAWGGKSLYAFNSTDNIPANHVSFERPYDPEGAVPITAEIGLVRFLERTGYDVSYTTNIDIDRVPAELKRHRLVISSGHDQYWTKGIRDAFEAARDGGTNLAFIGADIGDWQIRYEDDRRTIVEYRNAAVDPEPDPALKTVRFRDLVPSRPECTLRGVSFEGQDGPKYPRRSYLVNGSALKDRWFRGTGFTAKSRLRDSVGYEWDAIQPACAVPKLTVFFRYSGRNRSGARTRAQAVRYVAPSGARVFSSGSLRFVWGLDNTYSRKGVRPNPRLQRFMKNALAALTSKR